MNSTEGKTDGAPVHPVPAGDCLILVVDDESAIRRELKGENQLVENKPNEG